MNASPGARYTVLIVDDNEELLASLSFALKALGGFRIEVATDGAEGLAKAMQLQPDCMVIDVKMPEIDGLRLSRALRGDPDTASIPLVMLSALVQPTDQALGMYAGADQYLTKPAKPQTVIAAVLQAISLTEQQRSDRLRALVDDDGDDHT